MYKTLSTGQAQFSINGVTRSQGYIGQTSLSRSIPKTLKRGNDARGHGGCCGKYDTSQEVFPHDIWTMEDSTTVKPSVLSHTGMMSTQHRWIRRPAPYTSVKPAYDDSNLLQKTAHAQIEAVVQKNVKEIECFKAKQNQGPIPCVTTGCATIHKSAATGNITKPAISTVSQSEYIARLGNKCLPPAKRAALDVLRDPLPGN